MPKSLISLNGHSLREAQPAGRTRAPPPDGWAWAMHSFPLHWHHFHSLYILFHLIDLSWAEGRHLAYESRRPGLWLSPENIRLKIFPFWWPDSEQCWVIHYFSGSSFAAFPDISSHQSGLVVWRERAMKAHLLAIHRTPVLSEESENNHTSRASAVPTITEHLRPENSERAKWGAALIEISTSKVIWLNLILPIRKEMKWTAAYSATSTQCQHLERHFRIQILFNLWHYRCLLGKRENLSAF